jgi:hypothetical protein
MNEWLIQSARERPCEIIEGEVGCANAQKFEPGEYRRRRCAAGFPVALTAEDRDIRLRRFCFP